MEDIYNFSTDEILLSDINKVFKADSHYEVLKSSFFITTAMNQFKKYSEEFYNQKMFDKIDSFKVTVLAMGASLAVILFIFARFLNKFMNRLFQDLMASLYLIPYNVLLKDDKLREMIKHLDLK